MLKRGFTLAEVLITLMIVGIVATLTTPALVKNVGSSKIGPQLSKFVNTWETAVENMMMEENVNSMLAAGGDGVTYNSAIMDKVAKHMIMSKLDSTTTIKIHDSKGNDVTSASNLWQLKDGTIISIPYDAPPVYLYSEKASYKGSIAFILVDVGGINGAHRIGKEVFGFVLDDTGVLVPYGSNAHRSLVSDLKTCDLNALTKDNKPDVAALFACTGAVADNAWKAPW